MSRPTDERDGRDARIVRRHFDPAETDPSTAVAETVAELEGRSATDIATIYDCIDHVLDHLFAEPPAPAAQVQVEFTYENYRITVDQDGTARFIRVAEAT